MKARILIYCLVLAVAAGSAVYAGPFQKELVAANAVWVAHLDVERLIAADVGRYLLAETAKGRMADQVAAFQGVFILDVRREVTGISMFATDRDPDQSVAVANGTFDVQRLTALVRTKDSYKEYSHGSRLIQSWVEQPRTAAGKSPPRRFYACFVRKSAILFAPTLPAAREGVDVLDARKATLPESSYLFETVSGPAPSVFLTAAGDMAIILAAQGNAASPASKIRRFRFTMSETDGCVNGQADMACTSAESAQQVRLFIYALIGGAMLRTDSQPELAKFARSIKVSTHGARATLSFRYPVMDFIILLKKTPPEAILDPLSLQSAPSLPRIPWLNK